MARIKIKFNRQNRLNLDGTAPVVLELYFNRLSRLYKETEVSINPKFWDDKGKRIKSSHADHELLNKKIRQRKAAWEQYFLEQEILNRPINPETIRLMDRPGVKVDSCLINFIEETVIPISNSGFSKSTQTTYRTLVKHLKNFRGSASIPFSEFNYEFLTNFRVFLARKGLSRDSQNKYFRKLKKCKNEALFYKKITHDSDPFQGFNMSSEILQIHALSLDQLKKMESVDTRGDLALEKSKEMFLIQTYLCLRISDLVRLDLNCFSRDSHGDLNFSILTEKSPTLVEFNISDLHLDESGKSKPERLIQKYITLHSKAINAPRGLVSFFSKYQYNKNLKILADLAKIDYSKPLASHDARRTGISVLINDFCLNPVTVQKMAGHRKLETTMRYLKHEKTEINNSLKRVDWT